MLDKRIAAAVKKSLSASDWNVAERFLRKGFNRNGQIAVASVMMYAADVGKSVSEVLSVLEKHYQKIWQFQHPDVCGDPDAPGYSSVNRAALMDIHRELGLPAPKGL